MKLIKTDLIYDLLEEPNISAEAREFHALKRGHDLYDTRGSGTVKGKVKSIGNIKGEGRGKGKKRK